MPYDPVTGEYKEEESSVSTRMTGLLKKDNPYMQAAATRGKKVANRRGLLNSTMGVQATEAARIDAALPIASQDAAQTHTRNIQGRNIQFQDLSQERNIDAQREFLGTELTATQRRLETELGSRAKLQAADNVAQRHRLGMQLTQQERLQLDELRAAEERLGLELGSRERMQGVDVELQERLASMNLSANERNAAASLAQGYESTYSQMVSAIMSNPEIPAAERQRYLDHAARVRDSNLNLLEQFYGIELNWSTPGGAGSGFTMPGALPGGFPAPGGIPPNGAG